MRTLDKLLAPHLKLAPVLIKRAPTLTLAFDERRKSRLAATLDNGEEVAMLLPRGTVLRDGDVLVADDGGLVRVVAAAETVLVVRAKDTLTLTRAAYHLGNRHTPVEVGAPYQESQRVIESGLKPSDRVIVSGLQRVRADAEVKPKELKPADKPAGSVTQPAKPLIMNPK